MTEVLCYQTNNSLHSRAKKVSVSKGETQAPELQDLRMNNIQVQVHKLIYSHPTSFHLVRSKLFEPLLRDKHAV